MADAFPKPPGGNVKVENQDGVTRTFGDDSRHSLYNARWVGDGRGYGAFPPGEGEEGFPEPFYDEMRDTDRIDPFTGKRR